VTSAVNSEADVLVPSQMTLGESPIRLGEDDGFACVDIRQGEIHLGDLENGLTSSRRIGQTVGAIAVTTEQRLLVAPRRGGHPK